MGHYGVTEAEMNVAHSLEREKVSIEWWMLRDARPKHDDRSEPIML
jgi:hypothetical protein